MNGLRAAFDFAIGACVLAAIASVLRGGRYIHDELIAARSAVAVASNGSALSGVPAEGTQVAPAVAEAVERITAEEEEEAAAS